MRAFAAKEIVTALGPRSRDLERDIQAGGDILVHRFPPGHVPTINDYYFSARHYTGPGWVGAFIVEKFVSQINPARVLFALVMWSFAEPKRGTDTWNNAFLGI